MDDSEKNYQKLAEFAKQLIAEKSLQFSNEEEYRSYFQSLVDHLQEIVNNAVLDALPEYSLKMLAELADNPEPSEKAVKQIMDDSGIDYTNLAQKTLDDYRKQFLAEGANDE